MCNLFYAVISLPWSLRGAVGVEASHGLKTMCSFLISTAARPCGFLRALLYFSIFAAAEAGRPFKFGGPGRF